VVREKCVPAHNFGFTGTWECDYNQLYRGVVIQKEIDEMHRARGHVPFDPN